MKAFNTEWRSVHWLLLLLCLVAWLCYLPALHATFFSDDNVYLAYKNVALRGAHWTELGIFFTAPENPWEYLPIRDISYWLDFQLYEDEGVGFHFSNMLWYGAVSIVAWWLFRELYVFCRSGTAVEGATLALVGVVVFVCHPSHVEAVTWVASRKDLVGGTLGMFALAWSVRAVRCGCGVLQWGLIGGALLMATLGKSTAMVLVVMIAAVVMAGGWPEDRGLRRRRVIGLALVVLSAVTAWFIHSTVAASTGIRLENEIGHVATLERASRILVELLLMLVTPSPLGFYHDPYSIGNWHWLLSSATLLISCAALFSLFVRPQLWAFGVLLIVVSLLPYLQLVPYSTWSLASERFLFVAVAGLSVIVIDLASRLRSPKLVFMLLVAVVAVCSAVIFGRLQEWRSVDQLRAVEQARMPGFHNAKRDLIVYRLLPSGNYDEARAVAASLPRDYARDLLGSYIDYREVAVTTRVPATSQMPRALCSREEAVWASVARARVAVISEQDVSFNNIVRWVEQNMPHRDPGYRCHEQG